MNFAEPWQQSFCVVMVSTVSCEARGSWFESHWHMVWFFFSILKNFGFYEWFCLNNLFWLYFWISYISYFIKFLRQKFFLKWSCRGPWFALPFPSSWAMYIRTHIYSNTQLHEHTHVAKLFFLRHMYKFLQHLKPKVCEQTK